MISYIHDDTTYVVSLMISYIGFAAFKHTPLSGLAQEPVLAALLVLPMLAAAVVLVAVAVNDLTPTLTRYTSPTTAAAGGGT
jgi:hypothetical protein